MQTNIEIHSLTHVDLEELSALYNLSYQNYYVSINLSTEQFQGKLKMEDIIIYLTQWIIKGLFNSFANSICF